MKNLLKIAIIMPVLAGFLVVIPAAADGLFGSDGGAWDVIEQMNDRIRKDNERARAKERQRQAERERAEEQRRQRQAERERAEEQRRQAEAERKRAEERRIAQQKQANEDAAMKRYKDAFRRHQERYAKYDMAGGCKDFRASLGSEIWSYCYNHRNSNQGECQGGFRDFKEKADNECRSELASRTCEVGSHRITDITWVSSHSSAGVKYDFAVRCGAPKLSDFK